ncbi:DUF1488 family protein [Bordetella sp. LUAb4]|uniref:DUF1488 family protein n=1 Tax=Bordetella sp. LUAb4 TaxID=2843195 RepID=UPI001E57E7E5|nr:DUF1488 family protein [Bordetella sp. LUAb4]
MAANNIVINDNAVNDRSAHVIWFETASGARTIQAGVSWELLRARFGAGVEEASLLDAYHGNRRTLHALAERKFRESHPLPVLLSSSDFPSERAGR